MTNALSGKVTFRKLLLEGNHLSLAAIIGARAQLMRSGAPDIDVNFGVSLAEPVPTLVPANAPIQTSSRYPHLLLVQAYQEFTTNVFIFIVFSLQYRSKIVDEVAEAVFEIPGQVNIIYTRLLVYPVYHLGMHWQLCLLFFKLELYSSGVCSARTNYWRGSAVFD